MDNTELVFTVLVMIFIGAVAFYAGNKMGCETQKNSK